MDADNPPISECPCGRSPDPGIRPGGGCYCTDSPPAAPVSDAKEGEREAEPVSTTDEVIDRLESWDRFLAANPKVEPSMGWVRAAFDEGHKAGLAASAAPVSDAKDGASCICGHGPREHSIDEFDVRRDCRAQGCPCESFTRPGDVVAATAPRTVSERCVGCGNKLGDRTQPYIAPYCGICRTPIPAPVPDAKEGRVGILRPDLLEDDPPAVSDAKVEALREAVAAFGLMERYARAMANRAPANPSALERLWDDAQQKIEAARMAVSGEDTDA